MKIYIAHSKSYDFKTELYEPLKSSVLGKQNELVFPHETKTFVNSREIIKSCDLVIAEVSYPSIGEGIELGWANDSGVKIICVYKQGVKISGSISAVSQTLIGYADSSDLVNKLSEAINK